MGIIDYCCIILTCRGNNVWAFMSFGPIAAYSQNCLSFRLMTGISKETFPLPTQPVDMLHVKIVVGIAYSLRLDQNLVNIIKWPEYERESGHNDSLLTKSDFSLTFCGFNSKRCNRSIVQSIISHYVGDSSWLIVFIS